MKNTKSHHRPRKPLTIAVELAAVWVSSLTVSSLALAESPVSKEQFMEEVEVIGKYTINERIETATGLGLSLYETPQSVSVMTSFRIEDQQLQSLTDIVKNAPGVSAKSSDSSRHNFSARGFLIDNYQVDGIPISWTGGSDAGESQTDTSIYERIEVVRGATGLLTGAGNPSASINLVRKHANSTILTGNTSVAVGRWDTYRVSTDISGPLASDGSMRGRMVLKYEDGDSFRDLAGNTKQVLYGTVDVDITEQTLLRIGVSYQDNDPTASTWGGLPPWFSDGTRTDWKRSDTTATKWSSWASTVENYYIELMHGFNNGWEAKVSVNHNINTADLDLVWLPGVVNRETGLGLTPSTTRSDTERDQTSVNFQLSGDYSLFGRDHEFTFGAIDINENSVSIRTATETPAPVGNFFEWDGNYLQPISLGTKTKNLDLDTEQSGFYAATRLSLNERLKMVLGARTSDFERKGFWFVREQDFSDSGVVIPYAGILYDLTPQHTLYASYTEIFMPQEGVDRTLVTLDPIFGESTEVGLKSRFFDGALQTTIAYFDVLQDNLGQPDGAPIDLGGNNIILPLKETEGANSKGYEIEVVGQLLDSWDISFSYTHFTVEDANGDPVNTFQPDEMLKLYTTYRFSGDWENLTIAGGVNWETDTYTDVINAATGEPDRLSQDDFSLVSLMLRYDFSSQLTAQLNVNNVMDETYFEQIGQFRQLEFGRPRDVALSLSYQF